MSTIKTGWLKDKNGDKFAPKTLSSQVIDSDGVNLEDKIEDKLNELRNEMSEKDHNHDDLYETKEDANDKLAEGKLYTDTLISDKADKEHTHDLYETKEDAQLKYDELMAVKADWNQNDETAIDYIKNRPFYEGEPEIHYNLPEMTISNVDELSTGFTFIAGTLSIEDGKTYEVIINGNVYTAKCVQLDSSGFELGDRNLQEYPFYFLDRGIMYQVMYGVQEAPITIAIRTTTNSIKKLERKFVDGIAGMDVEGKTFTYNDIDYVAYNGAEIFNDYVTNMALGAYSHAEGERTNAFGFCSHAEGSSTVAYGMQSHAEGLGTDAHGNDSHAEGWCTIASGDYQHTQGKFNIEDTENKYAHIVGNGTYETRSNAHTLDWNGNAWFAGDVYVGGTSQDDASKLGEKDWNVNDEANPAYIKNRPFYEGDLEEYYVISETTITNSSNLSYGSYTIVGSIPLEIGATYEVLFNEDIYSVECYQGNIGASIGDQTLQEYPFYLFDGGFASMLKFAPQEEPLTIYVKGHRREIKKIERKFVEGITGKDVEGQTFIYNNTDYTELNGEYTAQNGAEIFNDYKNNIAAGAYSHAEGYNTAAMFMGAHAEGGGTLAYQNSSHAEGQSTIARGSASHAEGNSTIASGDYQHVQGAYNIEDIAGNSGKGRYLHIVGNGEMDAGVVTRSNAHTIDWDGNAWFAGKIRVGGTEYDNGSEVALKSDLANIDLSKYETKTDSQSKLDEAKAYADSTASTVKNDLLNGAGEAYDTLKELSELIDENQDAIGALETVAANKADKEHTHDGVYEVAGSIETAKTEIKTYVDEALASRIVVQIHTWEADD